MATDDDALFAEVLARLGDEGTRDLFRRPLERALQDLIGAELSAAIGARPHERTETRTNQRNRPASLGHTTDTDRLVKLTDGGWKIQYPALMHDRYSAPE